MIECLRHPTLRAWFEERFGRPTAPQEAAWPEIAAGRNLLLAAPTGTGKTLAAFLAGLDALAREGEGLPQATRIVYVSPLKALGEDVRRNLVGPLEELRERDPSFPVIEVAVRSGDTPQHVRQRMRRVPPHVLVTTPESLYLLLTSAGGREILRTTRSVIVDEIHAVYSERRGSHLAVSLERLEELVSHPLQRVGLSATQKPLEEVARFLVGRDRECEVRDCGHLRELDLGLILPDSLLGAVCSHEVWEELYRNLVAFIEPRRTTLIFTNTRKLAERLSARLQEIMGADAVTSHHGSLSKERRRDAEQRLAEGSLRALVATASLELGIDVGEVDQVVQIGVPASLAVFLQRVGRAGHGPGRVPVGRIVPLTRDDLVTAVALLSGTQQRELDRLLPPQPALDVAGQQVLAECCFEPLQEGDAFETLRRSWPFRDLEREPFERLLGHYATGRDALLHRDTVNGRLRSTRRTRLLAVTSGGTIPERGEYRVILEPEDTFIGTLEEDFVLESDRGTVFQLGNAAYRILKVESGAVRVGAAPGEVPNLPFWFGEAPARTSELSSLVGQVRLRANAEERFEELTLPAEAIDQLHGYVRKGAAALGVVPTADDVVLERFFDEGGGMQLVLHAPFGGRICKAWGLALRKRFCRSFGFELQAAATEDAVLLSLGMQHSFPLEEVFDYLHPETVREVLIQALLASPLFTNRFRWNASRMLLLPRQNGGKRVPIQLLRMRAEELLTQAFPEVVACGETLDPGDLPVPMDHPLIRQTIDDCLHEAMDLDGLVEVLGKLRSGEIRRHAVDLPQPSLFAHAILNANPYSFLDDAPLEERRTQAVRTDRGLDPETLAALGDLPEEIVQRVKREAWPDPRDAEEVHEALCWIGWIEEEEAAPWRTWLEELKVQGRVLHGDGRWRAVEAPTDEIEALGGRMEALGPVHAAHDDPRYRALEGRGLLLRTSWRGQPAWCHRRLLARIHRLSLEDRRLGFEPVAQARYLRFLARWHGRHPEHRFEGIEGLRRALLRLEAFPVAAAAWEKEVLTPRLKDYDPRWLEELTLGGEFAWGRLWGAGKTALGGTPLCLLPRERLEEWLALAGEPGETADLGHAAQDALALLEERGALFARDLEKAIRTLPAYLEEGLGELIAGGHATADSWLALRRLSAPPSRRIPSQLRLTGRWSLFRRSPAAASDDPRLVIDVLLERYGVLTRRGLERERIGLPWGQLHRELRLMELRGEVLGGRFVTGLSGEQFARKDAVESLNAAPSDPDPLAVASCDPLNLVGILTPEAKVPPRAGTSVELP